MSGVEMTSQGDKGVRFHADLMSVPTEDINPTLKTYTQAHKGNRRPSIHSLLFDKPSNSSPDEGQEEEVSSSIRRFGMWDGVFARCLLNIFGVIMFVRLGYLTGISGAGLMIAIICIAGVVTFITTLSLSAICTNGEVQGGGAYFMISRSLGPELGGSIGIIFGFANAVAVALYLLGFAESLVDLVGPIDWDMSDLWVLRLVSLISLVSVYVLCLIGVDWVIKIQLGLLVVLVACILSVIIGAFLKNKSENVVRFSGSLLSENFGSDFNETENFFYVLSIFFPAVTGIMAGANISGEIRSPERAIPNGTLGSVVVSTVVYCLLAIILAGCVPREVLLNNYLIMTDIAWAPLIYVGIFAATLSSAIASFVGAPRVLQAVAKDGLFPVLTPFALGHGKNDEPWRGYGLTFIISFCFILIGDINQVAPLITAFFMTSYAIINFSCFAGAYSNSPGFRPSFRHYNKWVAFLGFLLCIGMMFLMDWLVGIITLIIVFFLYKYIENKSPAVNWGSALDAIDFQTAYKALRKLQGAPIHVKNWRPNILFFGAEDDHKNMYYLAEQMKKGRGLNCVGNVILADTDDLQSDGALEAYKKLEERNVDAPLKDRFAKGTVGTAVFQQSFIAKTFYEGAHALIQTAGLSKLSANTICIGFKESWKEHPMATREYIQISREAFFLKMGVIILRRAPQLRVWPNAYDSSNTINVWWLADDGGLTILVPHLLKLHKMWKKCKLKIHMVQASLGSVAETRTQISEFIEQLRIPAELVIVPGKESAFLF